MRCSRRYILFILPMVLAFPVVGHAAGNILCAKDFVKKRRQSTLSVLSCNILFNRCCVFAQKSRLQHVPYSPVTPVVRVRRPGLPRSHLCAWCASFTSCSVGPSSPVWSIAGAEHQLEGECSELDPGCLQSSVKLAQNAANTGNLLKQNREDSEKPNWVTH